MRWMTRTILTLGGLLAAGTPARAQVAVGYSASGRLIPALDGLRLSLDGSKVVTGTVGDARLPLTLTGHTLVSTLLGGPLDAGLFKIVGLAQGTAPGEALHAGYAWSCGTGLTGCGDFTAVRTVRVADTGVVPGSYPTAGKVAVFDLNAQGQLTSVGSGTVNLVSGVDGVLGTANGGTGSAAVLGNNRAIVSASGAYAETASACPAGTVLVGGSPPDCSAAATLSTSLTTPRVNATPGSGTLILNAAAGNAVQLSEDDTTVLSASTSGLTATRELSMGTHPITSLGTPTAPSDAATKGYVDSEAAAAKTGGAVVIATFNQTGTWLDGNYAGVIGATEGAFPAAASSTPSVMPSAGVLKNCYSVTRGLTFDTPTFTLHQAPTGSTSYSATTVTMTQPAFGKFSDDTTHTVSVAAGDQFTVQQSGTHYAAPGYVMACQFIPN